MITHLRICLAYTGDNPKIVPSSLHGPPKIRLGVDGFQVAIGKDNVHREKLVSYQTMMALEPTMTTTQCWSEIADAFARSSDCAVDQSL